MRKEIIYDRETRDYAMYLDGELIGFARTYHKAEVELDGLVFQLLSDGHFNTATDLDGGAVEMPEGDWIDVEGMRVVAPSGIVVVQIANDPPIDIPDEYPDPTPSGPPPPEWRDLLTDALNVLDMALGYTHGATSTVGELRRLRARVEHAAQV